MLRVIVMSLTFLVTGCATIISGTSNDISFSTNVDPVRVYVDGLSVGNTPLTVSVEKKVGEGRIVRFEKEGYHTEEFKLRNKFDPVAVLDISSVIVSGGIDVLTGAIMEYSPREYYVEMRKQDLVVEKDHKNKIMFASFVLTNADSIRENIAMGGGPALEALIKLASNGGSTYAFSRWIVENTGSLLSTSSPESLLTKIRSSGMTP